MGNVNRGDDVAIHWATMFKVTMRRAAAAQ